MSSSTPEACVQVLPNGQFVVAVYEDGRYSACINEEGQEKLAVGGIFTWSLRELASCPYVFTFDSYDEALKKAEEIHEAEAKEAQAT